METDFRTVGIVGLGLIGGSAAKAISKNTNATVLGTDLNEETMQLAKMSGSIKDTLTPDSINRCDLILVALTPNRAIEWVLNNAKHISKTAVLVDLCGIKRTVMDALEPVAKSEGFEYVGGHPMAGKEVSGFSNSDAELFCGASMILVPTNTADVTTLDRLKTFFQSLGFTSLVFSDRDEHDRIIAYTSQLAHVTSSAYIKSPASRRHMGFSAGSYKDMTRVARLDPDMWTELFLDNADHLQDELSELIKNLCDYKDAIEKRDAKLLHSLLSDGLKIKLGEKD